MWFSSLMMWASERLNIIESFLRCICAIVTSLTYHHHMLEKDCNVFFYIFIISQRGSKKNSQNNFFFWLHDMANVWSIWKVDLLRHEKKFFTQSCLFITAKIPHPLTHSFIRFYWIHFVTIINNAGKSFNNSFH